MWIVAEYSYPLENKHKKGGYGDWASIKYISWLTMAVFGAIFVNKCPLFHGSHIHIQ